MRNLPNENCNKNKSKLPKRILNMIDMGENFKEWEIYEKNKNKYGETDIRTETSMLNVVKYYYNQKNFETCINFAKPLYIKYKNKNENRLQLEIKYYYLKCIFTIRKYAKILYGIETINEEKELDKIQNNIYNEAIKICGKNDNLTLKIKELKNTTDNINFEKFCEILYGIDDSEYKISQNEAIEIIREDEELKRNINKNFKEYILSFKPEKYATNIVKVNGEYFWNIQIYKAEINLFSEKGYRTINFDWKSMNECLNNARIMVNANTGEIINKV